MFFWKKSPKLKVRCYSASKQLMDLFPVEESRKFYPEWWENLPTYVEVGMGRKIPTSKVCPGINDLFKRGFVIPMWRDHIITWSHQNLISVDAPGSQSDELNRSHPPEQIGEAFTGWTHAKLLNPWFFETDRVVPFLMQDCTWNRDTHQDYVIPPGVLEFKYQGAAHINTFLSPVAQGHKEIFIPAGQPMAQLIPLEPVQLELELIEMDQKKFNSFYHYPWTFQNVYLKTRKVLEGRGK